MEIGPALAAWLEPFRVVTEGKLWSGHEISFQRSFGQVCEVGGVPRKANGLRQAFCTYHFAAHANENLTAQQAAILPP